MAWKLESHARYVTGIIKKIRLACKPHSVQRVFPPGWTSILAGGRPTARAVYPEMIGKWAFPARRLLSCLTLHRTGVTWPGALRRLPVVSYTTFSPLLPWGSGLFSVALFQTFTRFRALPGVLPCGVRTFLATEVPRPSGQPDFIITDGYYTIINKKKGIVH